MTSNTHPFIKGCLSIAGSIILGNALVDIIDPSPMGAQAIMVGFLALGVWNAWAQRRRR